MCLRTSISAHAVAGLTYIDYNAGGLTGHNRFEAFEAFEGFAAAELDLEGRATAGRGPLDATLPVAVPTVMTADFVRLRSQILHIARDALTRFAGSALGRDGFDLRLLGAAPVSLHAAAHWRAMARSGEHGQGLAAGWHCRGAAHRGVDVAGGHGRLPAPVPHHLERGPSAS